VVLALTGAGAAHAASQTVDAQGNAFTGGLAFNNAKITASVGDTITWRNTDFAVPHTATEDHNLWRLSGAYGGTGVTPPGFGPGDSRSRQFEAGTHSYFCEVHPTQMKGTVAVPPTIVGGKPATATTSRKRKHRRHHKKKKRKKKATAPATTSVAVVWAPGPPTSGEVFDVQRQAPGGAWQDVETDTVAPSGNYGVQAGTTAEFRARLKKPGGAATGWSPAAAVTG
jgi:plastocyanin